MTNFSCNSTIKDLTESISRKSSQKILCLELFLICYLSGFLFVFFRTCTCFRYELNYDIIRLIIAKSMKCELIIYWSIILFNFANFYASNNLDTHHLSPYNWKKWRGNNDFVIAPKRLRCLISDIWNDNSYPKSNKIVNTRCMYTLSSFMI